MDVKFGVYILVVLSSCCYGITNNVSIHSDAATAEVHNDRDFYQRFKARIATNYGVRYEIDYRFREEYRHNTKDVATWKRDDEHYLRHRTRIGAGVKPLYWLMRDESNKMLRTLRRIELYARLANEFRVHMDPGKRVRLEDIVLDQLYIDLPKPFDIPFSARVGRQDWYYGEGFIISDGTPKDGSRTYFFDGARLRWHISDMCAEWGGITHIPATSWQLPYTYADLLFALNRDENYAAFNESGGIHSDKLNDRDELLFGPYLTSELWDKTTGENRWNWLNRLQLEAYYIFKAENAYHSDDPFTLDFERDARIHTFGSRISGNIHDNDTHTLSFATEWAAQFGNHGRYLSGVRERTLLSYTGPYTYSGSKATRNYGNYPDYYADGSVPIRAASGYAWLEDYIKKIPWTDTRMPFQPKVKVLAGFLSGDDGYKGSTVDTGWHPLFNREDKLFNEDAKILSKLMELEGGENWWSNLQMYHAGLTISPFDPLPYIENAEKRSDRVYNICLDSLKNMTWNVGYSFLRANHNPFKERYEMGGGLNRGHLFSTGAQWDVNDYLSFKFLAETFFPGNYYASSSMERADYYTTGSDWVYNKKYTYLMEDHYYAKKPGYRDPAFFLRLECILKF